MVLGWIQWFILMIGGWVLLIGTWVNPDNPRNDLMLIMAMAFFMVSIIIGRINALEDKINGKK